MSFNNAVASRAVGQLPLSIATSCALEGALGTHIDFPTNKPPILKYEELWINVRTIFRNLIGSIDKNYVNGVPSSDLAETMSEEMDTIYATIRDATSDRVKVVFYYSNYANLESKYKSAVIRMDNTEKQKEYTALHNHAVKLLFQNYRAPKEIRTFDLKIKSEHQVNALIITHYAFDLLAHKTFKHLALLESHTGAIKQQAQFYTKYHGGKDLTQIPFREDFIQLFGCDTIFRPMDIRLRREVIELAKKYNWSAITTTSKIIYGLDQLKDHYHREILKKLLIH